MADAKLSSEDWRLVQALLGVKMHPAWNPSMSENIEDRRNQSPPSYPMTLWNQFTSERQNRSPWGGYYHHTGYEPQYQGGKGLSFDAGFNDVGRLPPGVK